MRNFRTHGLEEWYDEVEPRVQRRIVAEYRQGVRGYGYIATAKRLQLPVSTVRGVIARAERAGGDPVAPRGQKKRKLQQWGGGKVVQGSCTKPDRHE